MGNLRPGLKNPAEHNPEFIPHSRPTLGPAEGNAVSKVLESGHIAEGKTVQKFEKAFARKMGVRYAVAVSSGTAALHLVLLAMGIGSQDEVVIPSFVCTALLNAVRYVGAKPVPAEIDADTYNLDPADVKRRLTRHTKAVIVPHLFGLSADLDEFLALDVPVIEDCAQSAGGSYHQKPLGALGAAGIFSFYATKVLTTGEGGMVVSSSKKIIERVKDMKTYDKKDDCQIRFNYKMTDIQAAVGLVQLKRLDSFLHRRQAIARNYLETFKSLSLKLPPESADHIYYRFVIRLKTDLERFSRTLLQKGIGCARPVYLPLHQCLSLKGFSITEKAWKNSLSIPIYPSLSDEEVERVKMAVAGTRGI
jgi:perosamine synthetase